MALARPQYLEHVYRALGQALALDEPMVRSLLPGLEDYVRNSSYRTQAERREAIETLLNKIWKDVFGLPFDGHQMKHAFQAQTDLADIQEPLT